MYSTETSIAFDHIETPEHEQDVLCELDDVAISFGNQKVLDGVRFSVKRGERVSLIGPGSSGKSTVLKILLGLSRPDRGRVELFGTNMYGGGDRKKRDLLKRVGMAFQQGALFDYMTVAENLRFAADHMRHYNPIDRDEKIRDLLARVKLPRSLSQFPYELSGGMQRRVGIARALITEPEVALFDEPTAGLDPVTSTIILNMIHELVNPSITASMVVTSNVEVAIRFSRRVMVLHEGRIIADDDWSNLLLEGPEWVQNFLSCRLIGLDREYAENLQLPEEFIKRHWT